MRFSPCNRYTLTLTTLVSLFIGGCLERDLGLQGPRTTSLISEKLRQSPPTKLDLLLVVDNSASMADKQQVMAEAIPDLIRTLAVPPCVTGDGARVDRQNDACPPGSAPEFEALTDIQVGVITTSLGSAGGEQENNCDNEESTDMAHLLPTRPRAQHVPSDNGVLAWKLGQDTEGFIGNVRELVTLAGEVGCGGESSLEAWYRFLIDPTPYTKLVLGECRDGSRGCAKRETDANGVPAVDQALLAERAKFLRPDSLLAIVMLTDENDCSLREHPQAWAIGEADFMWRGSSACAVDPNDRCCMSCGTKNAPAECLVEGVLPGCAENGGKYSEKDLDDQPNLRCFDQKRRFGMDFLQPTARYVHALRSKELCFGSPDNDPQKCSPEERSLNPLYSQPGPFARTTPDSVILVGILGVPWQDVAVSPKPEDRLQYLPAVSTPDKPGINWAWLLPSPTQDPLMKESVDPREGIHPATGIPLAPPGAPRHAHPVNGHEHANVYRDELQFACIFPLPEGQRVCDPDGANGFGCDCDAADPAADGNPLCQAPDNSFGATQYFAKAYPGTRELEVLSQVADTAVVASICPKDMTDEAALDYGYRPAMQAIVDKVKTKLSELCFDRELTTDESGVTNCRVIELQATTEACSCTGTRSIPPANALDSVREQMLRLEVCEDPESCAKLCACEIAQVPPSTTGRVNSCQSEEQSSDNGWCYVDGAWGESSSRLVSNCRDNAQRKVRFVGDGIPRESSVTFLACQGSGYDDAP